MTAPNHSIKRKSEDAVAGIINSLKPSGTLTGVTAFKGFSGSDLSVPRYEVVAAEAEAEVFGVTITGNWTVTIRVAMISNANDDARSTHQANAATIEDVLMRDDVVSQLNSQSIGDFTAFLWHPDSGTDTVDGDTFKTEISGTLYAMPS